jgi:ribosomal protein S18 acetylase RimI-like enzyme
MIAVESVTELTPELVEVFERLMPQSHPTLPPPTRLELEQVVTGEATTLLLARDGETGAALGTATLVVYRTPARLHARLENVVVDEPARGRGAGEALTRESVKLAQQLGASVIELNTNPRREVANRLYQRVGFEQHHTNCYWIKF